MFFFKKYFQKNTQLEMWLCGILINHSKAEWQTEVYEFATVQNAGICILMTILHFKYYKLKCDKMS